MIEQSEYLLSDTGRRSDVIRCTDRLKNHALLTVRPPRVWYRTTKRVWSSTSFESSRGTIKCKKSIFVSLGVIEPLGLVYWSNSINHWSCSQVGVRKVNVVPKTLTRRPTTTLFYVHRVFLLTLCPFLPPPQVRLRFQTLWSVMGYFRV